ncbi:MAG: D-alanine--D-alanine ligase [Caldilineaceae bacterium]|nr:D-alanine--D-alanine ligase [Caldilineaceae bacterium]
MTDQNVSKPNGFEKPLRIGVVFGGRSSEHEVSLASAANVIDALGRAGYQVAPIGITPAGRWLIGGDPMKLLSDNAAGSPYAENGQTTIDQGEPTENWALLPSTNQAPQLAAIDVIFPVLHGPYGEDGTIQGLLEMANLPYVGCGVASSALAMDKALAKQLFAAAGLPQAPHRVILRNAYEADPEAICAAIEAAMPYPLFVKPANMGSSVGVTKARNRQELRAAIGIAARYDRKVLVEEAVPHCREIEVSVLGNDDAIASVPGEIIPGREFYDYAAKYLDDSSQLLIPAQLTPHQAARVQEMAIAAFHAVDGTGLARVDFLLDDQSGNFYLNEINTMPGFTHISMYPKLWEASGIPYPELVDRLVQLALARYDDRQQNSTTH